MITNKAGVAVVAAIVLAAGGCALAQNTLAQDMAWERWNKCKHFPNAMLKEIRPDGWIWYTYTIPPTDHQSLTACLRQAAEEQMASGRMTPPRQTRVLPDAVLPATNEMVAPTWKTGDEWAYRYDGPAGRGTYISTVRGEELIDGVWHYLLASGSRQHTYYRKADLAFTREVLDGAVVNHTKPSRLVYSWPLIVGRTWEQTYVEDRQRDRQTFERTSVWEVVADEEVTVPAGTFRTYKIVFKNARTNALIYEAWYSPAVKQMIKLREYVSGGRRDRELVDYRLK